MSPNLSPVLDLSEEETAPLETGQEIDRGAGHLQARLQSAFTPVAPEFSVIDATRTLATATLRQSEVFENFQERIVRLEHGPDLGLIRENVRDLCEALLHITVETKKAAAETENRFESLSDAMAALSGHMASHRQEVQANIAATNLLSEQFKQLQDEIAAQRAEAAELKALILSTTQSLRGDLDALKTEVAPLGARLESTEQGVAALETGLASLTRDGLDPLKGSVAQLSGDLAATKGQAADLNDTVVTLAHSSARYSEGLSVLDNALEAAKTQLHSLSESSACLTERLKLAEQAAETFARREKVLAELHSRAAQALGQ